MNSVSLTHAFNSRRVLWTLFYVVLTLLLLLPFSLDARGRGGDGGDGGRGGVIETGNARAESHAETRVDTGRTRTPVCLCGTESEAVIANDVHAEANTGGNSANGGGNGRSMVTLRELGLLQLAAHDFFNVNRTTEVDHENGDLDLSTLLDHGYGNIAIGGEPRNRENIILFTVAKEYGEYYLNLLTQGKTPEEARAKLVKRYHRELRELYEDLFNEDWPTPKAGEVTMTENLAFRTIHDLLPGFIEFNGEMIKTVHPDLVGEMLSKDEMERKSGILDGLFDPVFRSITIIIPPAIVFTIDLLERDSSFAAQFGTDHSFEHFLMELEDGSYDNDEDVMHYIRSLFAKGLYF